MNPRCAWLAALLLPSACATQLPLLHSQLEQEVIATERAFARTMAERDFPAFDDFIARDAVFFSGDQVLRGRDEVVASWRKLYAGATAPFSWQPEKVEVLAGGTLALSTGPVRGPDGKLIAQFTSIWRLEAPHVWRVVFDKGNDVCQCARP